MRSRRWRRHLLVAVLALAGIAVGLFFLRYEMPNERFTARAQAVCEDSKHDLLVASRAQLTGSGANRNQRAQAFLSDVMVPNLRERMRELRRLDPPDGDDEELRSLVADYEAVVDKIEADPAAYAKPGVDDPFAEVDRRFDDYGLPACGTAPPR